MELAIMSAAETQLGNLLSAGFTTTIDSFRIAGTIGVTVSSDGSGPAGPLLYTGEPSQVRYIPVSEHEVVFVIYLDDTVGGFTIGNFMLYLKAPNVGGNPIPFLWGSLPVGAEKDGDNFAQYVVGNNIVIYCACWFPYITQIIDFSTLTEFVAEFPQYANELALPAPAISEYEQVTIDAHSNYDAATVVVRENKNLEWFGLLFSQNINDPRLGQIDGGIAGSEYGSPSDIGYVNCSNYFTNNSGFPLIDGGTGWAVPDEPALIGGAY
jgi:hypothetical protein